MKKFSLKWDDFQKNLISAFGDLRDDQDFADVTLACEDEFIELSILQESIEENQNTTSNNIHERDESQSLDFNCVFHVYG